MILCTIIPLFLFLFKNIIFFLLISNKIYYSHDFYLRDSMILWCTIIMSPFFYYLKILFLFKINYLKIFIWSTICWYDFYYFHQYFYHLFYPFLSFLSLHYLSHINNSLSGKLSQRSLQYYSMLVKHDCNTAIKHQKFMAATSIMKEMI